ncbi:hypothetical protein PMAYCL1PPCAC_31121, partial [Pristionchus mayeri]
MSTRSAPSSSSRRATAKEESDSPQQTTRITRNSQGSSAKSQERPLRSGKRLSYAEYSSPESVRPRRTTKVEEPEDEEEELRVLADTLTPPKRGPGRPRKNPLPDQQSPQSPEKHQSASDGESPKGRKTVSKTRVYDSNEGRRLKNETTPSSSKITSPTRSSRSSKKIDDDGPSSSKNVSPRHSSRNKNADAETPTTSKWSSPRRGESARSIDQKTDQRKKRQAKTAKSDGTSDEDAIHTPRRVSKRLEKNPVLIMVETSDEEMDEGVSPRTLRTRRSNLEGDMKEEKEGEPVPKKRRGRPRSDEKKNEPGPSQPRSSPRNVKQEEEEQEDLKSDEERNAEESSTRMTRDAEGVCSSEIPNRNRRSSKAESLTTTPVKLRRTHSDAEIGSDDKLEEEESGPEPKTKRGKKIKEEPLSDEEFPVAKSPRPVRSCRMVTEVKMECVSDEKEEATSRRVLRSTAKHALNEGSNEGPSTSAEVPKKSADRDEEKEKEVLDEMAGEKLVSKKSSPSQRESDEKEEEEKEERKSASSSHEDDFYSVELGCSPQSKKSISRKSSRLSMKVSLDEVEPSTSADNYRKKCEEKADAEKGENEDDDEFSEELGMSSRKSSLQDSVETAAEDTEASIEFKDSPKEASPPQDGVEKECAGKRDENEAASSLSASSKDEKEELEENIVEEKEPELIE